MSSTYPIQQPYFTGLRSKGAQPAGANSFAGTLRAFTEKQQADPSNLPSPVIVDPEKRRPRPVGSPLTVGGAAAKAQPVPEAEVPEPAAEKVKSPRPSSSGLLGRAWSWLQKNNKFAAAKQLRVAETVSLGEKRFVALIDVEGRKFLVGGGASGVSLLTQLDSAHAAAEADLLIAPAGEPSK